MSPLQLTLALSLFAAGGQEAEPPLVLVLPVLGPAPREMQIPAADEIAEALLLQIPAGKVRVIPERPTSRVIPHEAETVFRARGQQIKARVVVWGELIEPADCQAPRRIKLRLLDVSSAVVLERMLCPLEAGASDLAGAMAVAVAAFFSSGLIEGIALAEKTKKPEPGLVDLAKGARRRSSAANRCPPCPSPAPSPATESACPPCPPCPKEPAARGKLRLSAGMLATTHPRPADAGLGMQFSATLQLGRRWEAGLEAGFAAPLSSIESTEVKAIYRSAPFGLRGGLVWGGERVEGLLELGLLLSWSRLEALLERFSGSVAIDRFDPVLRLRVGARWWLARQVALEFSAAGCYWLRTQSYQYIYLGLPIEVLRLQRWSAEGTLSLTVAFSLE